MSVMRSHNVRVQTGRDLHQIQMLCISHVQNVSKDPISGEDIMSYYLHEVAGRIRIKTPLIKKNPARAEHVSTIARQFRGVRSVETNTTTGSILITYDKNVLHHDIILTTLENSGYFDRTKIEQKDFVSRQAAVAGEFIGKAIFGYAAEKALESMGLSFVSALI